MIDYQFNILGRKCYIYLGSKYLGRVWVECDGEVKADAERDVMWLPVMEALAAMTESVAV